MTATVPACVRLVGPGVRLEPVPAGVAAAVDAGDAAALKRALAAAGLHASAGWPHDDTLVALDLGHPTRTWLVVLPEGQVVGEGGWKGPPDADGAVEIGYGLGVGARGRGLGTQAVGLLVAWTERQPGVRAVVAQVLPGNEASSRVLRRLGFQRCPGPGRHVRYERSATVRGRHVC